MTGDCARKSDEEGRWRVAPASREGMSAADKRGSFSRWSGSVSSSSSFAGASSALCTEGAEPEREEARVVGGAASGGGAVVSAGVKKGSLTASMTWSAICSASSSCGSPGWLTSSFVWIAGVKNADADCC